MKRRTKKQPNKTEQSSRGLMRYIFGGVAVCLVLLALLGYWLIDFVVKPANEKHRQELTGIYTQQYETYFTNMLKLLHERVRQVAGSDQVVRAASSGNLLLLENLSTALNSQMTGALATHIFATDQADVMSNTVPPVGFAQLDMIRRAEQGQQVPVEALQHESRPYLQIVEAIRSNDVIVGTISVSMNLSALKDGLGSFDVAAGSVSLEQKFNNGPKQTLMQYGTKNANPTLTIRTDNPNWQLTFQPSDQLYRSDIINPNIIIIPLAVFGAALLVVMAIAGYSLQKTVRNDAGDFTRYTQKLLSGHNMDLPSFKLSLFLSMAKSLARVRVKQRPPSPNEVTSPFSLPVGQLDLEPVAQDNQPLAPQDEILDIDMIEEDQDILGIDAPEAEPVISMQVEETIFRAYDIRGIIGETLDNTVARKIGRAIGSEAYERGEQTIIVARDGRLSSPELARNLVIGLTETGRDVIDLGAVPTPLMYYATEVLGITSGVMVTGSHNPGNHNGFKVVLSGQVLSGQEIKGLYHRINNQNFLKGSGSVTQNEIVGNYINRVAGEIRLGNRQLKVVIDAGNGIAGKVAPSLFGALGCTVHPINCEVDGRFPNHHPDPSDPANLQQLIKAVTETQADIGIAFDGDGDRLGIVSSSGKIIFADRLLMLFARDLLTRNNSATIIYDVKCSRHLHDMISGYGGQPVMWKSGHSLIKKKMRETNALLGGELSGHIFFKERWYGFDDGLYSAARLLEILQKTGQTIDELANTLPNDISTPEIPVSVDESSKFRIMERMARNAVFSGGKMSTIDGVRVEFNDGWGVVRASNTGSNLICRFEATNAAAMARIQESFKQQLLSIDSSLQFPF
ncbi:phosphomannomutase/phosphoglucomutase [Gynuella sunshinyii]|uniref:phosphomannomutase n=1 Tax=Gynuella sunshinyii YC6258 TaxID=1445510 RepID=A0A0C5V0Q5_9GAMM|nr:phosphomannomutase/phosphoglucomutase [Gynuella sunshinyii]AJQ93130.1 phosphomannomutase [Gynuella sunshinyii YC6258]